MFPAGQNVLVEYQIYMQTAIATTKFRLHNLPFVDMKNETESVTAALEDNR